MERPMDDTSGGKPGRSHARKVLMVGFAAREVEAMRAEGIDIVAALYVPEPDEGDVLPSIEHYLHDPVVCCLVTVPARPDFDPSLRHALYDAAIRMFRRHYGRSLQAHWRGAGSWLNQDNRFQIAANFYFDLLSRLGITDIVFSNIPHEGSYIILYHLARLMGLETLLVTQSQFPRRMWIMRNFEDYGSFETVAGAGESLPLPDEPTVPFYMKGATSRPKSAQASRIVLREAIKLGLKLITLQGLFKSASLQRSWNRLMLATEAMLEAQSVDRSKYVDAIDLDKPFVYFALHLQPELTTDTLGIEYADQLLALEELSAALGDDIDIYVKENPKQKDFMREDSFYERLRAIPNVKCVDVGLSSFELTRKCLCVATITGTVGWEALLMGRPVIHFGVTWYSSMPGVFRWCGTDTLHRALVFRGEREGLKTAFEALARKSYPGIIDPEYAAIVGDYDRDRDAGQAIRSLARVLREGWG